MPVHVHFDGPLTPIAYQQCPFALHPTKMYMHLYDPPQGRCVFIISGCWISDDKALVTISQRELIPDYLETHHQESSFSDEDENTQELVPKVQDL